MVAFDVRRDLSLLDPESDELRVVVGDIGDIPGLTRTLVTHRVSTVVHLAALIAASEDNPYHAVRINVSGTADVIEAQRLAGCRRMVFITSRAALGPITGVYAAPEFHPVAEDFPRRPISVYGSTKLAAEAIALAYRKRLGLDLVGLRFPAMYGPGRLARHGGFAIHCQLIEAAFQGQPFTLRAGVDQPDDVIFVGDAARAVALAVQAIRPALGVYHISSERLVTPRDFVAVLQARFPGWQVELGDAPGTGNMGYPSYCLFDDRRAQEDLGYRSGYALNEGIAAYLAVLQSGSIPG